MKTYILCSFVVRRLRELAKKKVFLFLLLFTYSIDLIKAYDSFDRTLVWTVLALSGVPPGMPTVIP